MKMGMNLLSVVCRPQVHKNKYALTRKIYNGANYVFVKLQYFEYQYQSGTNNESWN